MTAGVAHLEQAIQLDPSFALAYRSLGNRLYQPVWAIAWRDVCRQSI